MAADAADAGLRIKDVEIVVRVLVKVLHVMELRRPLFYFTVPGMLLAGAGVLIGLESMRVFAHGGSLQYATTLHMVLLTLVASLMALTGRILHSISGIMYECKSEILNLGKASHSGRGPAGRGKGGAGELEP
jgi:hypothetical protein